jgi:hypothetical protein
MSEALNIVFSSLWTYSGTVFLIVTIGYSASLPFYWMYKLKVIKASKSAWSHLGN